MMSFKRQKLHLHISIFRMSQRNCIIALLLFLLSFFGNVIIVLFAYCLSIGKILIFYIGYMLFTTNKTVYFIYGIIKFGFFRCSLSLSRSIKTSTQRKISHMYFSPHLQTGAFFFSLTVYLLAICYFSSFRLVHAPIYINITSRAILESFTHLIYHIQSYIILWDFFSLLSLQIE